jgi:conjugative transposon TraK protein
MFRQLRNIDTAFRHIRLFSIALVTACAITTCYTIYKCYDMVHAAQARIYILANGKALEAFSVGRKDNVPVEASDHVRVFHHFFFTLSPDDKAIQQNIRKALYLGDESVKRQYDNLRENGYYANIISGNVSQEVIVDSIHIDISSYPYYFQCHGTQKITRTTSVVTRSLVTEGYLRNVERSDNNPHGLLIERWSTIENKDIKIENR